MTVDPNANYYQPSQGSLTGFDSANLPQGNPNLAVTGWSLEQLRAFLLNVNAVNFPSPEWVQSIEQQILAHEANYNNPHHVTLDQIVGDFVTEVIGSVIPGTPPELPPFFSFDAICALPLGDIFPASFTTANIYRVTEGGVFVNPTTETEVIGSTYLTNRATLPLFSAFSTIVPAGWETQINTVINTTLSTPANPRLFYPFTFHLVSETAVTGSFGYQIPATEALATTYTATFFVLPTSLGGSLIIHQPSDTTNTMTVNLVDGTFTFTGTAVTGQTTVLPDGVIWISFSYISSSVTADNFIQVVHQNSGDTTPVRQGTNGRALFSIAGAQVSTQTINQPVLISSASPGSAGPLTLNFSVIPVPTTLSNFMVTLSLELYPTLTAPTDTAILTFGALTITRDASTIYVKVSGVTVFTSTILAGLNNLSLSYSPTQLSFKDLANDRSTVSGTYPALSTASVTMGPCGGYVHYIAFYGLSDTASCLEFLTNG